MQIKGHQRLVRIVIGGFYGREILVCCQFVKIVCGWITGVPRHRDVIFIEQSLIHLFNYLVFFAVWVLLSPFSTIMARKRKGVVSNTLSRSWQQGVSQQQRNGVLIVIVCIMFGCKFTIMSLHVKSYIMRIFPHRLATNIRAPPCLSAALWFLLITDC